MHFDLKNGTTSMSPEIADQQRTDTILKSSDPDLLSAQVLSIIILPADGLSLPHLAD